MPVIRDFRCLGAHLNTTGIRKAATLVKRFGRAGAMLRRLRRIPISAAAKAKAVRTIVYPAAMYGIGAVQVTRAKMANLAAAAKGTYLQ